MTRLDARKDRMPGRRWRILLNGIEQRHVMMADDRAGEILKCQLDERGKIFVDPAANEIATELIKGRVEIIPDER